MSDQRRRVPFSLIWPVVRTYAELDNAGQVVKCEPTSGPIKVVYPGEHDASCAARMLAELGQGPSEVYRCPQGRGARRGKHWHLTSAAEGP